MSNLNLIKQLRETTGAGMTDCQTALEESGGDMNLAIENLRKKGLEKAGQKAERATNEGVIALAREGNKIAVVALACETDFVARTDDFIKAVTNFAAELLSGQQADFKSWAESKIKNELTVKIGENLQLKNFEVLTGPVVGSYLHSNKKVAAVAVLSGGTESLANDIAMQIAAMSPKYISPADVPAEVLEKEKEIYREQMKDEKKPAEILEKIIEGKLGKFYSETCLLKQAFIKDEDQTIEKLLGEIKVEKFGRYQL